MITFPIRSQVCQIFPKQNFRLPRDQTQNRKAIEAVKPHLPANISFFEMEAANVQFLPIHLTVTAAVEADANFIRKKGLLVNKVVIPQPRPEILEDKI